MTKEALKSLKKGAVERVDKFLNSWISKKLTVFIIGSVALFNGNLESADWVVISTAYIAIQGFTDIVLLIYKSKNDGQNYPE